MLYRSEGLHGEPIAVSGVVIVPAGSIPPAGRQIVARAHPTTGIVSECAPSLTCVFFWTIQGLRDMLQRGYVVAATDYPGLGTAGPHPYLVGISEGRAVLDSVRVARLMRGAGGGRAFAVWRHSQLSDDLNTTSGKNVTAMALWSWSRVYGAPLFNVVRPAAVPAINELAGKCIERFFDLIARRGPSKRTRSQFLKVNNFQMSNRGAICLRAPRPRAFRRTSQFSLLKAPRTT